MFNFVSAPKIFDLPITVVSARFSESLADTNEAIPEALKNAVKGRRAEYIASRVCAKKAYNQISPDSIDHEFTNDADRSPIWPKGFCGSVTHTKNFTSVAMAPTREIASVGIDTEEHFNINTVKETEAIGSLTERALLLDSFSDAVCATLLFSAKESIYKCIYPFNRRFFDFHEVVLKAAFTDENILVFELQFNLPELNKKILTCHYEVGAALVSTGVAISASGESV